MQILIPAVQYRRPYGRRYEGAFEVDASEWEAERINTLYVKLGQLKDRKIEITVEMLFKHPTDQAASMVSICLDDGDHDFKMENVRNDEVVKTVLELVEGFDLEEYRSSRRANYLLPREPASDDVAEMVAHDLAAGLNAGEDEEDEL